jgi:hypothetical protein
MSRQKYIIALSVPLAILIIIVSLVGIYTPDFYAKETQNWQVQSIGQDIINLVFITPVLLVSSLLAARNWKPGRHLWGGALLYLIYTFTIYCFDVHFNKLFVLYCLILGFAFYAFLYFTFQRLREPTLYTTSLVRKIVGIYFISISVLFYFVWLSETMPAVIANSVPKTLEQAGLPTNPVHVIDLAIILPGIFMTGIFLLKNKKLGHILTPTMLMFFILMDVTIASLSAMMQQGGLEGRFLLTIIMSILALFSLALLIWYLRASRLKLKTYLTVNPNFGTGLIISRPVRFSANMSKP